jgi:hypothetical protein
MQAMQMNLSKLVKQPNQTMSTTTENTKVNGIDVDALSHAIETIAADRPTARESGGRLRMLYASELPGLAIFRGINCNTGFRQ